MKLCLACSAGGHLIELMQLKDFYVKFPHFFVSDARTNALELSKTEKVYFLACPRRNPFKLVLNFFQALGVFFREKPDAVVSTGADTALPFCFIAKLFGKKVIFIESIARINQPSLSGKIAYKFADLFFVQWQENLKFFPKAIYAGGVF